MVNKDQHLDKMIFVLINIIEPSCLGYSYDISGYDIVNKAHHLFG